MAAKQVALWLFRDDFIGGLIPSFAQDF
jgi:hypothetical protein